MQGIMGYHTMVAAIRPNDVLTLNTENFSTLFRYLYGAKETALYSTLYSTVKVYLNDITLSKFGGYRVIIFYS